MLQELILLNLKIQTILEIFSIYTTSADTWEKKTLTFAGDTSSAFGNDNAKSLTLRFYLSAGTAYTSGTLNTSWNSVTNANTAVGQVNFQLQQIMNYI